MKEKRQIAGATDLFLMYKYNANMELERDLTGLVCRVGIAIGAKVDSDIHEHMNDIQRLILYWA